MGSGVILGLGVELQGDVGVCLTEGNYECPHRQL